MFSSPLLPFGFGSDKHVTIRYGVYATPCVASYLILYTKRVVLIGILLPAEFSVFAFAVCALQVPCDVESTVTLVAPVGSNCADSCSERSCVDVYCDLFS